MPQSIKTEMFRYSLSQTEAEIRACLRGKLTDEEARDFLGLLPRQYESLKRSAFKKVRLIKKDDEDAKTKKT
ncbi:MAG: hypothetical protein IKV10_02075 [Alphaproteobacteria bacterium]|nr:hypothetical protein [Alphaproteobacteria bacterium]